MLLQESLGSSGPKCKYAMGPNMIFHTHTHTFISQQLKKRGLWEGVVQEPLRRALFCVFLCSEVIFSCKSHRNFFQKLPLQCRHFLENPLTKNPKTQLLNFYDLGTHFPITHRTFLTQGLLLRILLCISGALIRCFL